MYHLNTINEIPHFSESVH